MLQGGDIRVSRGWDGRGRRSNGTGFTGEGLLEDAEAIGTVALELLHDLRSGLAGRDAKQPAREQVERKAELLALPSIGGCHHHRPATLSHDLIAQDAQPLGAEGEPQEVRNRSQGHIESSILCLGDRDVITIEVDGPLTLRDKSRALRCLCIDLLAASTWRRVLTVVHSSHLVLLVLTAAPWPTTVFIMNTVGQHREVLGFPCSLYDTLCPGSCEQGVNRVSYGRG